MSRIQLTLMPGHGLAQIKNQLLEKNVPEDQIENVMVHCEWQASQSRTDAVNSSTETKITLTLPNSPQTGDNTRTKQESGRQFLNVAIHRADPNQSMDKNGALIAEKTRLSQTLEDKYTVVVDKHTTRADLERKLELQGITLNELQKQGYHVRADKNSTKLTFKRFASESNSLKQLFSGRAAKTKRGNELLNKILLRSSSTVGKQGGSNEPKTHPLIAHFSGIHKVSDTPLELHRVAFSGKPSFAELQKQLGNTRLEDLAKRGFHVEAKEENGLTTLTFMLRPQYENKVARFLAGHDQKRELGNRILRAVLTDAEQQGMSKVLRSNLEKTLSSELTQATDLLDETVVWPTTSKAARKLIEDSNNLTPLLRLPTAEDLVDTLQEMKRLSFLTGDASGMSKLLRDVDRYCQEHERVFGSQPDAESLKAAVERCVSYDGSFQKNEINHPIRELLVFELAKNENEIGLNERPCEKEAKLWEARVNTYQRAVELGFGPRDAMYVLQSRYQQDPNTTAKWPQIQSEFSSASYLQDDEAISSPVMDRFVEQRDGLKSNLKTLSRRHDQLSQSIVELKDKITSKTKEIEAIRSTMQEQRDQLPKLDYTAYRKAFGEEKLQEMLADLDHGTKGLSREAEEKISLLESELSTIQLDLQTAERNRNDIADDIQATTLKYNDLDGDINELDRNMRRLTALTQQAKENFLSNRE